MVNFRTMTMEGDYKSCFGGGATEWLQRGKFQLDVLLWRGLLPSNTVLDVGCGPLRAGVHIIDFLDAGNYYGIDCNPHFVSYAERVSAKLATFRTSCDFSSFDRCFDFILCFGVLKNCSEQEKELFVNRIWKVSTNKTRVIVSHVNWLNSMGLFAVEELALPDHLRYSPPDPHVLELKQACKLL